MKAGEKSEPFGMVTLKAKVGTKFVVAKDLAKQCPGDKFELKCQNQPSWATYDAKTGMCAAKPPMDLKADIKMSCIFYKHSAIAADNEKKAVTVTFKAKPAASACMINKKFDDVDMKAGSYGSLPMVTDINGKDIKDLTKCPGDRFKMTCKEEKVGRRRLSSSKVDCRKIPAYPKQPIIYLKQMEYKRTVVMHPEGLKALQDAGCQYEWHQKTTPFTPLQKLGVERDGSIFKADTTKGEDTEIRTIVKNIDIYIRGDFDKKKPKLYTFPVTLKAYPTKMAKSMPAPKPQGKPFSLKYDEKTGVASAQAPIQGKPIINTCKFEHFAADGTYKAEEATVTMLPPIDCTQVVHKFGEGPAKGKCFSDCDCDGQRTCQADYTCSGTPRPACPKVDCKAVASKLKAGCTLRPTKRMDLKTGCDAFPCGRPICPFIKPAPKCTLKTPEAPIKIKYGATSIIDILQLGGQTKNMFTFRRDKKT